MIDPARLDSIQARYQIQIQTAARDFGDHEGMGTPKIVRWLSQFKEADMQLALKILERITYISTENIRASIHQLVTLTYRKFHPIPPEKVYFIPVGSPQEGSSVIARAIREEVDENRIKHMAELERLQTGTFEALVFIDDFSGTGDQLRGWWNNVEPLILPREVPYAIGLLALTYQARTSIEQFMDVIYVHEIDENHNTRSPVSTMFSPEEKTKILEYCIETKCEDDYLRGYGNCGLLVAFKHQCPDNSLPILWERNQYWENLFKRSAI